MSVVYIVYNSTIVLINKHNDVVDLRVDDWVNQNNMELFHNIMFDLETSVVHVLHESKCLQSWKLHSPCACTLLAQCTHVFFKYYLKLIFTKKIMV